MIERVYGKHFAHQLPVDDDPEMLYQPKHRLGFSKAPWRWVFMERERPGDMNTPAIFYSQCGTCGYLIQPDNIELHVSLHQD